MNTKKLIESSNSPEEIVKTVTESDKGPRSYVFNRIQEYLKQNGLTNEVEVESKLGYDVFTLGKARLVNDGVGLSLKVGYDEKQYYSKPKREYKKAVQDFIELGK